MALLEKFDSAVAAEILYAPTPLRVWDGRGHLSFGGQTYVPGKMLGSSETSLEFDEPRQYASFDLSLTLAADRQFHFTEDRGPTPARIRWLWRLDSEDSWKQAVSVAGRVADTNYISGILTVQIQQVVYDVDRGQTLYMDNATQQRLHPGDLGFGYANQLAARGGVRSSLPWPP